MTKGTQLTEEQKATIEATGYGMTGVTGGVPKTTYYTPDGRVIRVSPNMRNYVRKNAEGKVIESGTRDSNLDNGWLLQKPTVLQVFCPTCDKWHKTKALVRKCKVDMGKRIAVHAQKAKQEDAPAQDKVANLEAAVAALTEQLKALTDAKSK